MSDENEICGICLNNIHDNNKIITKCHHLYCKPCITKWFTLNKNKNITCPICRSIINDLDEQIELTVNNNCHEFKYISYKICELLVKKDDYTLKFVPKEFKTYKLCLLAIKTDGYTLQWVPEEFKTKELCELAVKNDIRALEYMPEAYKTKELKNDQNKVDE